MVTALEFEKVWKTYALHCIIMGVWGYGSVTTCLYVQYLLPRNSHWFLRGCIFYVSFVVIFKSLYELANQYFYPGKIILPGERKRSRVSDAMCPDYEVRKGFLLAMLLRGLTFISTSKEFSLPFLQEGGPNFFYWAYEVHNTVFMWTVIYDFFYYWIHRSFHMNTKLYKWIHAKHHSIREPYRGVTLLHTIQEMIFEILGPTLLTQLVLKLSPENLVIAYVNIQISEVTGHSGTDWKMPGWCFFPGLAEILGFALHIPDHDAHHAERVVNFSKQFTLWDKLYGTYQPGHKSSLRLQSVSKYEN